MTLDEYLANFDESDINTTAAIHVAEVCRHAVGRESIIELGTHQGLATAAIKLAAPAARVVTVDWGNHPDRQHRWLAAGLEPGDIFEVQTEVSSLLRGLLRARGRCGLIFHDASHGDAVVEEYLDCAALADVVAIHDFELLSPLNRERVLGVLEPLHESADSRGRVLFVGRPK